MDVHPTPFPGNKAQSVKSKYKKTSDAPKEKINEAPKQMHRRTFGTIRNPNVPEKIVPQKPKAKPSNQVSVKQSKTEPEVLPVTKTGSAKKTPQSGSNERSRQRKKKTVSFPEKTEGSVTKKSPETGVKTPVRPPFSVKPVRIPGTPYLSAEKCSSCQFDRLETASYWLGQIKSAEAVGKHFVSAAFFRLAHECKAEPAQKLQIEVKKYLGRHDYLSSKTEWEGVCCIYGISKKKSDTKSNGDKMSLFNDKTFTRSGSEADDVGDVQEHCVENLDQE